MKKKTIFSNIQARSIIISDFFDTISTRFLRGSQRLELMIFFARTMAMMLKSGVSINKAFAILEQSGARWSRILWRTIGHSLQEGRTIHESLAQYPWLFSSSFIQTIRVGELSGNLSKNLDDIALQLRKQRELERRIKESLLYPFMVLILAVLLGILMVYFIFPKITPLLLTLNVELPLSTRILLWITRFTETYGTWIAIIGGGGVMGGIWAGRQQFAKPILHGIFLHTPIFQHIVYGSNISHFCRNMGMLIKSGLAIDEALEIVGNALGNFYYRKTVGHLRKDIQGGTQLSKSMQKFPSFFPSLVLNMVQAGEESGRMEEAFFYLADFYEDEVDVAARALARIIEPLLLLFLGLIVAFMALAVITPIFRVTGGIGK